MKSHLAGPRNDELLSPERLTCLLAERVLGWSAKPDRFITKGRDWMPAWRFKPLERIEDAFRLLNAAKPEEYSIIARRGMVFSVRVQLNDTVGEADDSSQARAITFAVGRAFGIEPTGGEPSKIEGTRR